MVSKHIVAHDGAVASPQWKDELHALPGWLEYPSRAVSGPSVR